MADVCDDADVHMEAESAARLAHVAKAVQQIEPGHAGECDLCGEYNPRLVNRKGDDVCSPCRDRLKLG